MLKNHHGKQSLKASEMSIKRWTKKMARHTCMALNTVISACAGWFIFNWLGYGSIEEVGVNLILSFGIAVTIGAITYGFGAGILNYLFRPRFKGWR